MRPRKKPEEAPQGTPLQPGSHKATPETNVRVNEVAKKISKGWTKFETTQWVMETYNVNDTSANRYWNAALNKLTQDANDQDYIAEMRRKTVSTLERLIQSEVDEGRYKEANASMELLSKLLGYNVSKVEAKVDGDIKFSFGE